MTQNHDSTVSAASRDSATVTPQGESLAAQIHGVSTASPVNHVDHRGRVFEIFAGESEHWQSPLVYCYGFSVRPNQTKGWGLHEHKDDRYTLITGEVLTILFDARTDSPTHGLVQKVSLSPEGLRQLLIPAGVWHISICLSPTEAILINHPTQVYHHGSPDRLLLPWNTDKIPVDVASFFPNQLRA